MRTGTYDLAFLPITPSNLRIGIETHSHDAVALYQLVRRAATQKQMETAYDTLEIMKNEQPNNAVVHAAFCFAYQVASGEYSVPGDSVGFRPATLGSTAEYLSCLNQAKQLDQKLWLIYDVEGHPLVLNPHEDVQGLALLLKAERLAPNISITHYFLGWAYSIYYTPYQSFQKAASEFQISLAMKPVLANAALSLFDIYDIRTPDAQKAREAKHEIRQTLPPNVKLSAEGEKRLAQYP